MTEERAVQNGKKKMIFVVTEDHYFYSHRLPMARAAMNAGCEVAVITNVKDYREAIEAENIRVIPLSLERRSLNPFKALLHIARLYKVYRHERPDIVHHIAMKPILYGGLAARFAKVPAVVNAFAGLGYLFTDNGFKARVLRTGLAPFFAFALKYKGVHVLFQNEDDLGVLKARKLLPPQERVSVIRGSGVDLALYPAQKLADFAPEVICAFAARMIGIKGLPTLKKAFEILQTRSPQIRLWLCGTPDPANPGSWTQEQLEAWQEEAANVTYKGYCNMKEIWPKAHIAVQPSYGGEGVPKALLEAAASARAIVASDVAGCREVVEEGRNGYLVPPHDAEALATAIEQAAHSFEHCRALGEESRKIIEEQGFSAESVAAQTEALYRALLDDRANQAG